MKRYTKNGDAGETTLVSGEKIKKDALQIEVVGDIDECNSFIGAALSQFSLEEELDPLRSQLVEVQKSLFDLGTFVVSQETDELATLRFDGDSIKQLEKWIDQLERKLPSLRHFILPGGDPGGALLHVARSVCRRAERTITTLVFQKKTTTQPIAYLNRLADYLFVLARYVNQVTHSKETPWKPDPARVKTKSPVYR